MAFNEQFIRACKNGDLDTIREIYMWNPNIDISAEDEEAFRCACENEHLEVVRQLYEWKPTIDISAHDEWAFRKACYNGHLKIVRQLYDWKPTIDLPKFNQYRSLFISLGITFHSRLTKDLSLKKKHYNVLSVEILYL